MKKYSREHLKKRLIVCSVLGIIVGIAVAVINITAAGMPLIYAALMLLCIVIVFPIECFGVSFNFGKILLGMVAPIPILSMIIESFKSIVYAIKGIIVIIKKQDYLIIGKGEETDA